MSSFPTRHTGRRRRLRTRIARRCTPRCEISPSLECVVAVARMCSIVFVYLIFSSSSPESYFILSRIILRVRAEPHAARDGAGSALAVDHQFVRSGASAHRVSRLYSDARSQERLCAVPGRRGRRSGCVCAVFFLDNSVYFESHIVGVSFCLPPLYSFCFKCRLFLHHP